MSLYIPISFFQNNPQPLKYAWENMSKIIFWKENIKDYALRELYRNLAIFAILLHVDTWQNTVYPYHMSHKL